MDYTIIGGQVNIASRLQSVAPPDSIYLSQPAYELVEDFVEARHIGPISLKGIHAPVEVWELLSLKTGAGDNGGPSLVSFGDGHIRLQALDIDPAALDETQAADIRKALSQVLVALSTQRKA
jgi:hypothetical protein